MQHKLWIAGGIVFGMMLGAQAHAQSSAATSAASKASSGPEAASGFGKDANYATLQEFQHGGMTFNGSVKVEDAPFPWDPIPVVVTCNGVVRYRTEADGKGRFTIRGDNSPSEITPVKTNPHEESASHLVGCDAEASLPGFKSTKLYIMNGTIMDDPNIGTIVLRPDSGAAGSSTSATTGSASKEAVKHFDKARTDTFNNNANGAEHELEKAVKADPNFAEAWYQLGKLQQAKGQQAALASYQKAVAADPKFVPPYEYIAELSATQKKWQDVVNATSAALKLDPAGTPQLWYFDAVGKYNLGQVDDAETSARKSLAIDPQHMAPNTEQLLAVMLAGQGQLEEALHHLQNSLTYIKSGPNLDIIKQQIAQLERAMPQDASK